MERDEFVNKFGRDSNWLYDAVMKLAEGVVSEFETVLTETFFDFTPNVVYQYWVLAKTKTYDIVLKTDGGAEILISMGNSDACLVTVVHGVEFVKVVEWRGALEFMLKTANEPSAKIRLQKKTRGR